MKWVNVELNQADAVDFAVFLRKHGVCYESSGCGFGLTHFECHMDDAMIAKANEFLASL